MLFPLYFLAKLAGLFNAAPSWFPSTEVHPWWQTEACVIAFTLAIAFLYASRMARATGRLKAADRLLFGMMLCMAAALALLLGPLDEHPHTALGNVNDVAYQEDLFFLAMRHLLVTAGVALASIVSYRMWTAPRDVRRRASFWPFRLTCAAAGIAVVALGLFG